MEVAGKLFVAVIMMDQYAFECAESQMGADGGRMAGEVVATGGDTGVATGARGDADSQFAEWILGPVANVPAFSRRKGLQAALFDLDGVLVDTAEFHFQAWKRLADDLDLPFDRQMNQGFRGVSRMECLEKLLGVHGRLFVGAEKVLLAERKNEYYLEQVMGLGMGDVAPGGRELLAGLKGLSEGGARLAVVSASRNAKLVLGRLGLLDLFDTVVDGGDVIRGKPDPEGFLLAAERVRTRPENCVILEDAEAGIRAARAAGIKSVGIGEAARGADVAVEELKQVGVAMLEDLCPASGTQG